MDPNTGAKRRQKELSDIYCYKNKNKEGEFYPRGGGKGGTPGCSGDFLGFEIFDSGIFFGRN